jgi:hypothetical protein
MPLFPALPFLEIPELKELPLPALGAFAMQKEYVTQLVI